MHAAAEADCEEAERLAAVTASATIWNFSNLSMMTIAEIHGSCVRIRTQLRAKVHAVHAVHARCVHMCTQCVIGREGGVRSVHG